MALPSPSGPLAVWQAYNHACNRDDLTAASRHVVPDLAVTINGAAALDVPGCSVVRCVDGRITEARLYHPTGALDRVAARALGRQ